MTRRGTRFVATVLVGLLIALFTGPAQATVVPVAAGTESGWRFIEVNTVLGMVSEALAPAAAPTTSYRFVEVNTAMLPSAPEAADNQMAGTFPTFGLQIIAPY